MTFSKKIVRRGLVLVLAMASAGPIMAFAQDAYPSRPIKLVVGYAPGASTDIVAREIAKGLSERLKVPVIVENKSGANTIIATTQVAKSAPDGYTLLLSNSSNATNPWVYTGLPFDAQKDFKHIGLAAIGYNLVSASPKLGVNNVKDLISYAKRNPNQFSYGTVGVGSSQHLLMTLIGKRAGIELNHIPYRGAVAAMTDVLGGTLSGMIGTITTQNEMVKKGRLKPLFVSSLARSKFLPDVETLEENGLTGLNSGYWMGLSGPAGLPPAIVARLNKELNDMLRSPETLERLAQQSIDPLGGTAAEMDTFFDSEMKFWKEAVAAAGLTPTQIPN